MKLFLTGYLLGALCFAFPFLIVGMALGEWKAGLPGRVVAWFERKRKAVGDGAPEETRGNPDTSPAKVAVASVTEGSHLEPQQSALCTKRSGTSGSHCDHQTSPQLHPMIPRGKQFTCCHCGRIREEPFRPDFGGQTFTTKDHGPHVPQTYVIN